jgi:crotonobetainyl-CoA:carnitine CoA-transferase CaiB-like acyl-CoA transferase
MQPLAGIQVVEFGSMISVPYAAMILGEMGADVIKVERPTGDESRQSAPFWRDVSAYNFNLNRGKKSVVLDLRQPRDVEAAVLLCERADVVMENFRPGVAKRLGLDFERFRADNPRLVTAAVRGYGDDGPRITDRVYDPIIQAMSSMASGQGGNDSPQFVRTFLPDKVASMALVQSVLAALYRRERTGRGGDILLSMLDATVNFLWPEGMMHHTFTEAPIDEELAGRPPRVGHLIRDVDGRWLACASITDVQWVALCTAVGVPELAVTYADPMNRLRGHGDVSAALNAACRDLRRDEILQRLRVVDVPCAPVNTVSDVLVDPQVVHNGTVITEQTDDLGGIRRPRPLVTLDNEPVSGPWRAPALGEHTEEVLAGLYADEPDYQRRRNA